MDKNLKNEDLKQVSGGNEVSNSGYFRCSNPDCPVHYRKMSYAPEECLECGWPIEWVEC